MFIKLNTLVGVTAHLGLLFTPFLAQAQDTTGAKSWPMTVAIQSQAGQKIPVGAYGVIEIDTPRVATLLQLRGVVGRGTAVMRSGYNHDCLSLSLRFVAGDFGGSNISTYKSNPIRLILQSAKVSNALARGEDIISDEYRISSNKGDINADIIIERGLGESHGFVLNPGSSVVSDVFGTKAKRTKCSQI